jgi:hypothetical protein
MHMQDNSTKYMGHLIKQFLQQEYPDISEVKLLHSASNLFRYDENIVFVKQQLLPLVDGFRCASIMLIIHALSKKVSHYFEYPPNHHHHYHHLLLHLLLVVHRHLL